MKVIVVVVLALMVVGAIAGDHGHGGGGGGGGHDWGYKQNGADWGGKCQSGHRQSPIDVVTRKVRGRGPKLDIYYNAVPNLSIYNNGHAIQVDGNLGYVETDGANYTVKQFHFHAPAEHTINGKTFPAEMHIVHQREGATGLDGLLVVGLIFESNPTSADNPLLSKLGFDNAATVPGEKGKKYTLSQPVDLFNDILELDGPKYSFKGSLTTPPCAEGVKWRLLAETQEISQKQLNNINSVFSGNHAFADGKGNNRAVQKRYGRTIRLIPEAAL